MPLPILRYPLDTTGLSPDNFVNGEIHTLSNKAIRALAPTYGAYFTESLKVFDNRTQLQLVRGTQYLCTELLQTPSELYGKEISYLILIIDPNVSSDIVIQYQVLGGLYTRSADAIISLYENAMTNEAVVTWANVSNTPSEYPPTPHLHDIRDTMGYEFMVTGLERIRNAIIASDVPIYENIMNWLAAEIATIKANNIGVVATHAEALAGVVDDKTMTPLKVMEVMKSGAGSRAKNYFLSQI